MSFTTGFSVCALVSAGIWQFESLISRVQSHVDGMKSIWLDVICPQEEGHLRRLTSLGDGQRTVTGIIVTNTLLFCFWRVQSLHCTMVRFLTSNPASKALWSQILLSMITPLFLFIFLFLMLCVYLYASQFLPSISLPQILIPFLLPLANKKVLTTCLLLPGVSSLVRTKSIFSHWDQTRLRSAVYVPGASDCASMVLVGISVFGCSMGVWVSWVSWCSYVVVLLFSIFSLSLNSTSGWIQWPGLSICLSVSQLLVGPLTGKPCQALVCEHTMASVIVTGLGHPHEMDPKLGWPLDVFPSVSSPFLFL